jgi:hypothetical protein
MAIRYHHRHTIFRVEICTTHVRPVVDVIMMLDSTTALRTSINMHLPSRPEPRSVVLNAVEAALLHL